MPLSGAKSSAFLPNATNTVPNAFFATFVKKKRGMAMPQRRAKSRVIDSKTQQVDEEPEQVFEQEAYDLPPGVEFNGHLKMENSNLDIRLASLFGYSSLYAVREIEWGTTILGYEQANKYTIRDLAGRIVGYMAESGTGVFYRTLMKSHRRFSVTLFDINGEPLIEITRPFKWLNSYVTVTESGTSIPVAEVHSQWHLLRRQYALYVNKTQFAEINAPFLSWDFVLQDADGHPLGQVNRNWTGFGTELFTNAGTYVVHLQPPNGVREMTLEERIATFAAAVTIDFDYFSEKGHGGFFFLPPFFVSGESSELADSDQPNAKTGTGILEDQDLLDAKKDDYLEFDED